MVKPVAAALCLLAGAAGFSLTSTGLDSRAAYTIAPVDVPGANQTVAAGIDTLGRIVGYFTDSSGTHGFLLTDGAFTTIAFPGAPWTAAYGINTAGQIVGAYGPEATTGRHGFLRNGTNFSLIDFPGGTDTVARGVNNRGQIVGDYVGPDGLRHAYLMSGGQFRSLDFPGGGAATASGINDSGQIVGVLGSGSSAKAFSLDGGAYSILQFPERPYTEARGINGVGDIVGVIDSPQAPSRAFHRSGDVYAVIDLTAVGTSWDGRAINDLGQVVGSFLGTDGKTHGYRATPTSLRAGPSDAGASTPVAGGSRPGGPAGPAGPGGQAGGRGGGRPARNPLQPARDALGRGLSTLERRLNEEDAQKAKANILLAMEDVDAAMAHVAAHPESASEQPPIVERPNFAVAVEDQVAAPPVWVICLNQLRNAFDALAAAPGGDLGGLRAKGLGHIAAAANDLFKGIDVAKAELAGRRGRGRGQAAAGPATPPPQ